jgi:hypothetical protein
MDEKGKIAGTKRYERGSIYNAEYVTLDQVVTSKFGS